MQGELEAKGIDSFIFLGKFAGIHRIDVPKSLANIHQTDVEPVFRSHGGIFGHNLATMPITVLAHLGGDQGANFQFLTIQKTSRKFVQFLKEID